jgi:hypothetical protein
VVQAFPTEGGNMVDRCCCRVGSRIIQHTRTTVSELSAPSPHHLLSTWRQDHTPPLDGYGCLPGTHYSVVLFLTQHCAGTTHSKQEMLPVDKDHIDTPPVLRGPRK